MSRTFILALPVLALALAWAAGVQADAFKCRTPEGATIISSAPCQDGSKTLSIQPGERLTTEQRLRAELEAERQRRLVAERDAARSSDEMRELEIRQRLAEDDSAQRSQCLQNAEKEPDPRFRADLIAACNGVAPQRPVVIQQPVLVPLPTVRRPQRPGWACIGNDCRTFEPPPPRPAGQGITGCRLVGSLMRCD